MQLTWDDEYTDMNLEVDIPNGTKDIEDVCLPIEHFYVKSESDIEAGVYKVYVRNKPGAVPSKIPQEVHLAIDTPTKAVVFDFNITATDMLNLGHVADIIISKEKVTLVPQRTGNPPKITYYSTESYVSYLYHYIYDIYSRLKQGLLGPLSNAQVDIYDANNTKKSIYTTRATGGDSILTAGVIYIPSDVLSDDKYYVVSVSQGDDIDADDNGITDATHTPNSGTIRAIIRGNKLKRDNFKVNVLSEAIYQLSKNLLNQNASVISQKLNDLAKRVLFSDVDGNGIIDYEDVLCWMPMYNKDSLLKDYDMFYKPVVQKIYKNEDIYDDVYAIAYDVYLKPQTLHIKENSQAGTVVGKIEVGLYDGSVNFVLQGDGSKNFQVDKTGVITVADGAVLDYESKREYVFKVTAKNRYGSSQSEKLTIDINNLPEPPTIQPVNIKIKKDTPVGEQIGVLNIKSDVAVKSVSLSGEGSEDFSIDINGVIAVAKKLDYLVKKEYILEAVATNVYGSSKNVSVIIKLVPNTPFLIGSYDTPGYAEDVAISKDGKTAYVADGNSGLQIIDISFLTW